MAGLRFMSPSRDATYPEYFVLVQNVQAFNSSAVGIAVPRRNPFALLPVVPFHRKIASAWTCFLDHSPHNLITAWN